MSMNEELNQYKKIEDELRKERNKNTAQYQEILKLMNENEELKMEIDNLIGGEERTKILSTMVEELKSKNEDLVSEMQKIK